MSQPKICSWLGVQVCQPFWITDMPDVEFRILEDGTFATKPINIVGSAYSLLRLIEQPDKIRLKKPRKWTKQDREDARAILRLFPNAKEVHRHKDSGFITVYIGCQYHILNDRLFPLIEPGECVAISDILDV